MAEVVVIGQIARDLALLVSDLPEAGDTRPVRERREMLGGKGANQAVCLTRMGRSASLLGVVGDDAAAEWLLGQASRDGIDIQRVVRRAGSESGLVVDIVDENGSWRYLEDLPDRTLVSANDIAGADGVFDGARAVLIQLQQPGATCRAAAAAAKERGLLVIVDGAPEPADREVLLDLADVVRADRKEAQLWIGQDLSGTDEVLAAARRLASQGPNLVAFACADGNALAWGGGSALLPLVDTTTVDTTGAGDAFTAGLAAELLASGDAMRAGRYASAAASLVVEHLGGRPGFDDDAIRHRMERQNHAVRAAES